MPSQLTYPGVYIEEISSGVRTITGVATSIAAFVGWAPQGPTDRALRIGSFLDYQRFYGQIHPKSYLGYSVKQFFENGGTDAYVLRLSAKNGSVAEGNLTEVDQVGECNCAGLTFTANSPGDWSNSYGVKIEVRTGTSGIKKFTLTVVRFRAGEDGQPITNDLTKSPPTVVEVFPNLSTEPNDPRFVEDIIGDEVRGSIYIKVKELGDLGDTTGPVPFQGGTITLPEKIDDFSNELIADLERAAQEEGTLDKIDLFNLLCVPGLTDATKLGALASFCQFRRAMLIADCAKEAKLTSLQAGAGIDGERKNAAFYFPWILAPDALANGAITDFPPVGFVAGLYAKTDATRGVWKAPAGTEVRLTGALKPKVVLTDNENGRVNIKAVNCIRQFPVQGTVIWGARTLDGDDEVGSEWKYVPVRRTALYIEESLYRGTKWAVFEPNDEPLWAQLRLNIGAFMHDLFRQGAFQGRTPREAYFVKCDKETTTQNDINRGIVNVIVGFAPLKPAEFVVIKLQQIAGQIET